MTKIKKQNMKKGISMIVVLWIMAILTVLTTATALMTQGDIASTINIIKRKGALQLAESGSDYFISLIPDNNLINTEIVANASGFSLFYRCSYSEGFRTRFFHRLASKTYVHILAE